MRILPDLEGFEEGKAEPTASGNVGNCGRIHGMERRPFHFQRDPCNGGSWRAWDGNALEISRSDWICQGMEEVGNRLSVREEEVYMACH